jgi:hypothetical protein
MERTRTIISIFAVLFVIGISGAVVAAGTQHRPFPRAGVHHPRGNNELRLLSGYVYKNLMVKTLSELTGKPVETLDQQLKSEGFRAVMDEYKVDWMAFRTAVRGNEDKLIEDLVAKGYLTPEQQQKIAEQRELRAQRHTLMTLLVEKGVKDGTITQEQARMLLPRHR